MRCVRIICCFLLVFFVISYTHANEFFDLAIRLVGGSEENSVIDILETLVTELNEKEQELSRIRQQIHTIPASAAIELLSTVREDVRELRLQFERFAVDVDIRPFTEERDMKFDWQQEIGRLLRPIIVEVEFATRQSRVIGELRSQISTVIKERELAEDALANIEKLTSLPVSPELTKRLNKLHMVWNRRYQGAQNQLNALDFMLERELAQQESPLDAGVSYTRNFLKIRGINLLLGIIAFCAVFFGIRFLAFVCRGLFWHRGNRQGMGSRFVTLIVQIFSILGGMLATLMVFSFTADWFLFTVALIFLIGIGWASFSTLPQYIETLRLMMNIGAVREGERIELDGVPWLVERIGLRARLINPLLDSGKQILPLNLLVGRYSRPAGKSEEWFPCSQGDWVHLADGNVGCVSYQTPSAVQIIMAGGDRIVYHTPAFLALNPQNMSANLRIASTFGVDYKHLAICTSRIPDVIGKSLKRELAKIVDTAAILDVAVLFKAATSSSLEYQVWVDLAGEAAPFFKIVEYHIQRILVDVCIEQGWDIPFTQVMLHHAAERADTGSLKKMPVKNLDDDEKS